MKKLNPVIKESGKTILIMDADEANGDWLIAHRLLKKGDKKSLKELKRKLNTPL